MSERILVIDDDVDTLRLVGLMLQRQNYQVSAASNGSQGLTKAFEERPDLILLDVMMPDMDGYEVTRRLRKNPTTAAIPILMFTAKTQLDDKVAGFEVGADDYLTKPTHPTELLSHVRALLTRTTSKSPGDLGTGSQEKNGYLIGVLSARAGLGVSTVAANIAAGLFTLTQSETILAELRPGQGTLGADLGIPPQKGLLEILQGTVMDVTPKKVKSSLVNHPSGIKVLAASEHPRDVDLVSKTENFETLVMRLSALARFIILDLGSGLSYTTQRMATMCADRIIVMEGTQNSIRHARLLLNEFTLMKVNPKTVSVIMNNRMRSDAKISLSQAQEQLGHNILTVLTPMPELFLQAARAHTPAVIAQPANAVSQQFIKIADGILEREKAR
jgi:pilus assembly protein CpaE